jgi:hypothetical protein
VFGLGHEFIIALAAFLLAYHFGMRYVITYLAHRRTRQATQRGPCLAGQRWCQQSVIRAGYYQLPLDRLLWRGDGISEHDQDALDLIREAPATFGATIR